MSQNEAEAAGSWLRAGCKQGRGHYGHDAGLCVFAGFEFSKSGLPARRDSGLRVLQYTDVHFSVKRILWATWKIFLPRARLRGGETCGSKNGVGAEIYRRHRSG